MGIIGAVLAVILSPFFIVACVIRAFVRKHEEAERKAYLDYLERDRRERARKLETERQQRVQREELEKKANIERFHRNIFPVETENSSIAAVWSRYPSGLHDMPEKIERQKKALYKTTPVLISTDKMVGFFCPSSDSYCYEVYYTTLNDCSCPDYAKHTGPCKHIYRLFYELNYKYSPGVIDVAPGLEEFLLSIPSKEFYDLVIEIHCPVKTVSVLTEACERLVDAGIMLAQKPTDEQYGELLNSMTKDQIILSLAKKNITGYYPSWSKVRLIAWIIENQPGYLMKQFKHYACFEFSPSIAPWVDGVRDSFSHYHYHMTDDEIQATFDRSDSGLFID